MTRHLPHLFALLIASVCTASQGGEFSLSPIRLTLSGAARTQLLAITNTGDSPARFLVRAAAWTVTDSGAVELTPDDGLVVFPASFTIAAKATQNVRAGTDQATGDTEKTWRIVLEELPDPNPAGNAGTTINVLSVLSVPVFMPPRTVRKATSITLQSVAGPTATLQITNDGNAHELISTVSVAAMRGSDQLAQARQEGWYVLPGRSRIFKMSTPKAWCTPEITAFELRATDRDGQVLAQQTVDARQACR